MTTQLIALLTDRHALLAEIRRRVAKYSEDQPRDEHGRWVSGGGGGDMTEDVMEHVNIGDEEADYSAEERAGQAWQKTLSASEASALRAYRDAGRFRMINDYMRGGSSSRAAREYAEGLRSALERGRVPDGTAVYRGMSIFGSVEAENIKAQLRGSFHDDGFLSASPASSIAGNFVAHEEASVGVLFKLTTNGAKGAYISQPGKEPEYLIQHGAKITVTKVTEYKSGFLFVEGHVGHR